MVHPTAKAQKLISTRCGMRRILKQQQYSVADYIRAAVQSGSYKPEKIPEGEDERGNDRQRRGKPFAYPVAYEILQMNPPIPEEPRIPLKHLKHSSSNDQVHLPTDPLIKSYLKRYDERVRTHAHPSTAEEEEAYYARILGIDPVKDSKTKSNFTAMGRKNVVLSHAYQFALRQHQVLQENKDMSEEESIQIVEQLLKDQNKNEREVSRQRTEKVVEWRAAKTAQEAPTSEHHDDNEDSHEPTATAEEHTGESNQASIPVSTIPSVLFNKPRTIQAMRTWGMRLQAVPYDQWTVGAATTLDHWIAVEVLGMAEQTWNSLLDGSGDDPRDLQQLSDEEYGESDLIHVGNMARARDIVTVRNALFPETLLFSTDATHETLESLYDNEIITQTTIQPANDEDDDDNDDDELKATERSIDELLASLGGFDEKTDGTANNTGQTEQEDEVDEDILISDMVDKLQDWRVMNQESPFESWDSNTKIQFNTFLTKYIEVFSSDIENINDVDLDATREALLSESPMTRGESDSFWSQMRDETQAEIFLQRLLEDGAPAVKENESKAEIKSREAYAAFLALPYDLQLRKLVDMGTLRPIFDEYTSEADRVDFMKRYGETLMEGVEVEHLVPDPQGPIRGTDLEGTEFDSKQIKSDDRFRIQLIPHGTDEYGTKRSERARALYQAWNVVKGGRARYEEILFRKGKLGLKRNLDKK